MKCFSILIFLFVASTSQAQVEKRQEVISAGEVRLIEFPLTKADARLNCRNEMIKFSRRNDRAQAMIVESYFSEAKPFSCILTVAGKESIIFNFTIAQKDYKSEILKVDMKKIKLSPKDQNRAGKEQLVLNKIYASSLPDFQFTQPFIKPLETHITSMYGNRRVYNNHKKSQHLGTDFRAAIGDKVPSANRGKIVFSGDLFYTGGTVIIDHGLDLFTVYGHLSKPTAIAGKMVERGEVIGFSGNTGRTSGPHLHWGVKVQGQYVDGFSVIEETQKVLSDKK